MKKKRIGLIIVPPGVFVDIHEKLTADFFASKMGYNVAFLVPNRHKGTKTPDIEMNGLLWEIKGPKGKGSRVIENNLRNAIRQSPNVILDLRRIDGRIPTEKLLKDVERQFILTRLIRRIIVITRQEGYVDFER